MKNWKKYVGISPFFAFLVAKCPRFHPWYRLRRIMWFQGGIYLIILGSIDGAEESLNLASHQEIWPKQVIVLVAVNLSGPSGTTQLPSGSTLDVLGLEGSIVLVGLGDMRGRIALTNTDFQRNAEKQWKNLIVTQAEETRMALIQEAKSMPQISVPRRGNLLVDHSNLSEQADPHFWLDIDEGLKPGALENVNLRNGATIEETRDYVNQVYGGIDDLIQTSDLSLVGLYHLIYEKFRVIPPNQIEVLLEAAEQGKFVPYEILDSKLNPENADYLWKHVKPGVNLYNYESCTDQYPWNVTPPNILDLVLSHGLQKNHEPQILQAFENYLAKSDVQGQWLNDARIYGKNREALLAISTERGTPTQEFRDTRWIEAMGRLGLFVDKELAFDLITKSKSRDAAFAYAFRPNSPYNKDVLQKRLFDEEVQRCVNQTKSFAETFNQTELFSDLALLGNPEAVEFLLERDARSENGDNFRFHSQSELVSYEILRSGQVSRENRKAEQETEEKLLFFSLAEYSAQLGVEDHGDGVKFNKDYCLFNNIIYHTEGGRVWSFRPMAKAPVNSVLPSGSDPIPNQKLTWFKDNKTKLKFHPLDYGAAFYLETDPEYLKAQNLLKACTRGLATEREDDYIASIAKTLNEEEPDHHVPLLDSENQSHVNFPLSESVNLRILDPMVFRLSNANFHQTISQPPFMNGKRLIQLLSQISEKRVGRLHQENKSPTDNFSIYWMPESDFLSYLLTPLTGPEDTKIFADYRPTSVLLRRANPFRLYPSWKEYLSPSVGLRLKNLSANQVRGDQIQMAAVVFKPEVTHELQRIFFEGASFDSTKPALPVEFSGDPTLNPILYGSILAIRKQSELRRLVADVILASTCNNKPADLVGEAKEVENSASLAEADWQCTGWHNQHAFVGLIQVAALNGYTSALSQVVKYLQASDWQMKLNPSLKDLHEAEKLDLSRGYPHTCEEFLKDIQRSLVMEANLLKLDYSRLPSSVLNGKPPQGFRDGGYLDEMIDFEGSSDTLDGNDNIILYGENSYPDLPGAFFGRFGEQEFLTQMRHQIFPLIGKEGFKGWLLTNVQKLIWDNKISKYRFISSPQ